MSQEPLTTGEAFKALLKEVDVDKQLEYLKQEVLKTKSVSKRDAMVKQIKYLAGLKKLGGSPASQFVIHNMPVLPPIVRPMMQQGNNRVKYADINYLYKDHMTVNSKVPGLKEDLLDSDPDLQKARADAYDGVKAIFGVGEALKGSSRAKNLKGLLRQIGGDSGPKGGFFQAKILSKKQDFSGRATIYAEPNLGFNEMAVPEDMIWTLYNFHIVRDLVKNGYKFSEAKEAAENRTPAAKASMAKLIKEIPIIANRAPTLMQSNVTAHFPVPVKGKTLGINPLHLPLYAGDFDGDAMTIHTPMTPEAVVEARKKLLPEHHIYDFRKGLGKSMVAPGHEAILGSVHMTEPDMTQKVREFNSEQEVLKALESGEISENTPIKLKST